MALHDVLDGMKLPLLGGREVGYQDQLQRVPLGVGGFVEVLAFDRNPGG